MSSPMSCWWKKSRVSIWKQIDARMHAGTESQPRRWRAAILARSPGERVCPSLFRRWRPDQRNPPPLHTADSSGSTAQLPFPLDIGNSLFYCMSLIPWLFFPSFFFLPLWRCIGITCSVLYVWDFFNFLFYLSRYIGFFSHYVSFFHLVASSSFTTRRTGSLVWFCVSFFTERCIDRLFLIYARIPSLVQTSFSFSLSLSVFFFIFLSDYKRDTFLQQIIKTMRSFLKYLPDHMARHMYDAIYIYYMMW